MIMQSHLREKFCLAEHRFNSRFNYMPLTFRDDSADRFQRGTDTVP